MNVQRDIEEYLAGLPEPKRSEMRDLHRSIAKRVPSRDLWFMDGKNAEGKAVSNPNIGYGRQIMAYANGKTREFYRVGISANTAGISVYILGLEDKAYLAKTYGKKMGKASITGYCIKFKTLKEVSIETLESAIRFGLKAGKPRVARKGNAP